MLQPWVHFVPVATDLSDLPARVRWLQEHDGEARAISQAARRFAEAHLSTHALLSYHQTLLQRYADLYQPRPLAPPLACPATGSISAQIPLHAAFPHSSPLTLCKRPPR